MAWTLNAHTEANFSSGTTGGTSSGIDTTGTTLLLVWIMCYQGSGSNAPYPSGAGQFTDSKSNTWTMRQNFSCGANGGTQDFHLYLFECVSPTVGTGHTFTITTGNSRLSEPGCPGLVWEPRVVPVRSTIIRG